MVRFQLEIYIAAPTEGVWELVADHERMPEWSAAREVIRRRPGSPDPNGVGAIRTVRAGGIVVDERITAFKPHERLEYTLVEGAPVRDHHAELVLTPWGQGTNVRWATSFRPLVPGTGWILGFALRRGLRRALAGLKRRAELARGGRALRPE